MSSRIKLWGVVLSLFLLVSALFYYHFYHNQKPSLLSPSLTLTEDAVFSYQTSDIVVKIKDFFQSPFGNYILKSPEFNNFFTTVSTVDSLLDQYPALNKFIQNNDVNISLHRTSVKHYDFLLLCNAKGNISNKDIENFLSSFTTIPPVIRNFEGTSIFDFQLTANSSFFAFAFIDDFFAFSKNPILVEDAIRLLQQEKSNSENSINTPRKINRELSIRLISLKGLFQQYFIPESVLANFAGISGEAQYQFGIDDNLLYLRGNITGHDSTDMFYTLISKQEPRKSDLFKVLSSRIAVLSAYNIPDYPQWYTHFVAGVDEDIYFSKLKQFENTHQVSLKKDIIPLLYGSASTAYFEPFGNRLANSKAIVVKVIETDKSTRLFKQWPHPGSSINKPGFKQSATYKDYTIHTTFLAASFELILGKPFSMSDPAYFVNIRDYLIFSENISLLYKIIDDYSNMQTLSTSASFNKFYDNLSSQFNYLLYVNPARTTQWVENSLKENLKTSKYTMFSFLKGFGAFAFQVSGAKEHYYNEILLNAQPEVKSVREFMMEAEMDTLIATRPVPVLNHNTKNYELIVFDKKNQMYLVDQSGKILWKRPLDSPPVGKLYQVDLYNNQKLQYCFTTENHLQLIDRLGRDVANYPIRLSSKTTTGVAVFDFRKNNSNRSYVGCDNQYVFGYNKNGKPLNGWRPAKINGNLTMPLKYFIKNGKVYLFGITAKGMFYLWDQNGNHVIKPLVLETLFSNPFRIQFEKSIENTHLISLDSSGNTYFIYLNGQVEINSFGKWNKNTWFDYTDLDGDEEKELVYTQGNTLLAYTHKGQVKLSVTLPYTVDSRPEFVNLDNNLFIAYLNTRHHQLILCDLDGQIHQNFPIDCDAGFEFFDMDNDGQPEVIGAFGSKLFIARY